MNFLNIISGWMNRYFSQEDAVYLVVALSLIMVLLYTLGGALAPVLTGLVIAFLLEGLVTRLQNMRMPRILAVNISVFLFVSSVMAIVFLIVPLLWQQMQSLGRLVPTLVTRLQEGLLNLAERFPEYVTQAQVEAIVEQGARELGNVSGAILESAFSQVFSVFGLLIYLVLVPISVFFLLKDKDALMNWVASILPKTFTPKLVASVGVRDERPAGQRRCAAKCWRFLIVGGVTFVTFILFGLNYAASAGSDRWRFCVLIPFVGAADSDLAGICSGGFAVRLVTLDLGVDHVGLSSLSSFWTAMFWCRYYYSPRLWTCTPSQLLLRCSPSAASAASGGSSLLFPWRP